MGVGWGCDVDHVGPRTLEHAFEVRIDAGDAKPLRRLSGQVRVVVAYGHDAGARNVPNGAQVSVRDLAAADDRDRQGWWRAHGSSPRSDGREAWAINHQFSVALLVCVGHDATVELLADANTTGCAELASQRPVVHQAQ